MLRLMQIKHWNDSKKAFAALPPDAHIRLCQRSFSGGKIMQIDIGISENDRREIAEGLSRLLADTYTLYLKTHSFHWNVTGPMFNTLHLMFETQYNELALAVDLIAERIRALGFPAPGSYAQYAALTSIKEATDVPKAEEMIRQLVAGQEAVVRTARSIFPAAEKVGDEPTADLLTQRMQLHEKTAWMLRSMLES
jgi:starvation-inducible DNA-binding protein